MAPQELLDEVADAVLDGTPVDWAAVESRADAGARALIGELRILASLRRPGGRGEASAPTPFDRWGHLRVLECVGRGAFGEVYRAWDPRLDREVALKLLRNSGRVDAAQPAAIEEGRLLARVRHPNVVTIYGAECLDGRVGLWMEFVEGNTLEQIVRQGGPLPVPDVTRVGVDLCGAVSAVHGAGLVHRDIKAQNLIVADDGRLVLMDFGTGLELHGDQAPAAAGTPLYLAPEVLAGGAATVQTDVYAIGVVLFRLLTGAYPVSASDLEGLRRAHALGERTRLRSLRPDVPPRLARVVEHALDSDPARRPASADAFRAALAGVGAASPLVRAAYVSAAVLALVAGLWATGALDARAPAVRPEPSASAGATGSQPLAIAVLPFRTLGSAAETSYLAEGLTEEIVRNFAAIDGLTLRSQTSAAFFREQPLDPARIGAQLQVGLILTGAVQRDGQRLRITAQLVSASDNVVLWSERYDRTMAEVFAIQDEISRAVAGKLKVTLGGTPHPYRPPVDTYELYLQARARVRRAGTDNGKEAAALFEKVIATDPAYAPAYAGLAEAYAAMSWQIPGLSPDEGLKRMRPAALKAVELDPSLAEAHAAMGATLARELDWRSARASYERAIELNPSLTDIQTNYSNSTLLPVGDTERALQLLESALVTDPLSLNVRRELAFAMIAAGRYDEAITHLRQALAVDPDLPFANLQLARALSFAERPQEAIAFWESRPESRRSWERWMTHAYVRLGRHQDVARLMKANENDHPYRQALVHAAVGDVDRTFAALDAAVALMPQRTALLLALPEMALLRGDPRLAALRRRLRLP
jgi:TolB-like protein/Tfp pilus assembly protein PilF